MNAVEIEAAISELADQAFDAQEFPYAFLAAFGSKDTTLKRLRAGNNNASDVQGHGIHGVLLRNNIHMATCESGHVSETLAALRSSPATLKAKAKFILATDGLTLEAEELMSVAKLDGQSIGISGEHIASAYEDFPNHFGFFLPLAGISTIKEIKDNPIDIRATGRLNKLYVELLKENPAWAAADRRHDMNHFMARLIFCFFAEDTDIFNGEGLFTQTVEQMSQRDGSNTHEVLEAVFRAMNTKVGARHLTPADQPKLPTKLPNWANGLPYVNGGLFSGSTEVPRFTAIARTYLLAAGRLKWREINPDIFGSMLQAVADDEERGALGMHYTSVPNILKVLNPLFLDDLREQLNAAADNKAKLLNLRKRMARIRVFDPACGSGNFLVIAYKQMREIEFEINKLRGEKDQGSEIPLTNFRGIELRDFPAEIARLALIIAEFQCDVKYRGQKDALLEFLPLSNQNWIVCGNALRLDWLSVCPPTGTGVKLLSDDLFGTPLNQTEIDFSNEGGETYICGNPPYVGSNVKALKGATKEKKEKLKRDAESRKADLKAVFENRTSTWGTLDYVAGWFIKAVEYGAKTKSVAAFVATNSICQGQQVPVIWPLIFDAGYQISFAHTSFKWKNLAAKNAGVTVVIVGLSNQLKKSCKLYVSDVERESTVKDVENINAYLVPFKNIVINKRTGAISDVAPMSFGNMANDNVGLLLKLYEVNEALRTHGVANHFIRAFLGSDEAIDGKQRYCLWLNSSQYVQACRNDWLKKRFSEVAAHRFASDRGATKKLTNTPYRFGEIRQVGDEIPVVIPRHSSENREYLPFALGKSGDSASALYNAPLWNVAIFGSRLHLAWIATVCGKLETRYRYSNTLGWNTFPVPPLTEANKAELTQCAENILLAREAHFPATIADLYDPEAMPANLRAAHEHNDETLERIYIGRRFKNDTERLEKLFELYTKMTAAENAKPSLKATKGKAK